MLLYRPGAVLSLRSVMLEFEAVYTGLPVCSLCLFFETAKLIPRHKSGGPAPPTAGREAAKQTRHEEIPSLWLAMTGRGRGFCIALRNSG